MLSSFLAQKIQRKKTLPWANRSMDKSSIVLDIKQTNATTKQSPSCRLKVNCEISSSLTSGLIVLNDRNSLWIRIHSLRFYCFLRIGTYVTTVWHVHKKACCWSRDTRRGRIRPLLSSSAPFLSFSLKNNNIYLYREEGKELFNFNRCCKAPIKYCINIIIRFFLTSELLRIRLLKTEVDDSCVKVW